MASSDAPIPRPAPTLLLDGASLWFRSFYGVPQSITTPGGLPVNALRGFLDTIATLVERFSPAGLVVARDVAWRPAFRVAALPAYKAQRVGDDGVREEVPAELTAQIPWILELLGLLGVATAEAPDTEADDVLAALAATTASAIVVSGDRDLLQVVDDDTQVYYVGRGMAKAELLGPQEVADVYGVPVARAGAAYAEMAVLRGDPSDGLPGVKGIGAKTAATLISEFGSLDALEAAAAQPDSTLKPAVRANLVAAHHYLVAARTVVVARTDIRPVLDGSAAPPLDPDTDAVGGRAAELGITRVVERLLALR